MIFLYGLTAFIILATLAFSILTFRFVKDKKIEEKLWHNLRSDRLSSPDAVKNLSILPLVEYYTNCDEFAGEPGVSYLITADEKKILLDVGYNIRREHPSPLLKNMEKLGVKLSDTDFVFITHLHRDHIGGNQNERKKAFSISGQNIDLNGMKVYAPTKMSHPTAQIDVIEGPRILSKGIVSTGPIHKALWLMGLTVEQSLVINVEGKGLVLIVGCGHQGIERLIERTKELFDIPLYAIIGGLHYPVTASRMKYNVQRMFGTGKLPWRWITKDEVKMSMAYLLGEDFRIVGLSAHDSCDWTLGLFRETFGERFRDVVVGKEIII